MIKQLVSSFVLVSLLLVVGCDNKAELARQQAVQAAQQKAIIEQETVQLSRAFFAALKKNPLQTGDEDLEHYSDFLNAITAKSTELQRTYSKADKKLVQFIDTSISFMDSYLKGRKEINEKSTKFRDALSDGVQVGAETQSNTKGRVIAGGVVGVFSYVVHHFVRNEEQEKVANRMDEEQIRQKEFHQQTVDLF